MSQEPGVGQGLQDRLGRKWRSHKHPWAVRKIRMNERPRDRLEGCSYLARITEAIFKSARIIVTWHVPIATHEIVNVLAQRRGPSSIFTSSETELGRGHEVLPGQMNGHQTRRVAGTNGPLVHLLQLAIVECAGEDETSDGIAWN
jgi:hypothetical protein